MSEFENTNMSELPKPTNEELFELFLRGEISEDRLDLESDYIAMQEAVERYEQKKAARREKLSRIMGRITFRRDK
ncbi:MAG: hypothetical protein L0H36_01630 [bacterium]|nr:hypothetical protein [bacterium]